MSDASQALLKRIAAVLLEPQDDYVMEFGDLVDVIGQMTMGAFLKTKFENPAERMEWFDAYAAEVRARIENEVAAGAAIEGKFKVSP